MDVTKHLCALLQVSPTEKVGSFFKTGPVLPACAECTLPERVGHATLEADFQLAAACLTSHVVTQVQIWRRTRAPAGRPAERRQLHTEHGREPWRERGSEERD